MQVASSTLYGPVNLTVIEAGSGEDAWVVIPFETGTATVRILDGRHVFAYTHRQDWAIFDAAERRRIFGSTGRAKLGYADSLIVPGISCFSPENRALFLVGRHDQTSSYNIIQEVPVDGRPTRVHRLPVDAHIVQLMPRADGAVVALSLSGERGTLRIILHPRDGEVQADRLDDAPYFSGRADYGPQWISPDGRWALRKPLGPLILSPGRRAGLLERFMPRRRAAAEHPDLLNDGEPRCALAMELIELDPLRHAKTLVLAYRRWEELRLFKRDVETLEAWFRRPSAGGPRLLPRSHAESKDSAQAEVTALAETHILNCLNDVVWDANSAGFSIWIGCYQLESKPNEFGIHPGEWRQWRRHVTIEGTVGDLEPVESQSTRNQLPNASERAVKAATAMIKERSTQVVPLRGSNAADLRIAIEEMTRRIDGGPLSDLTFAGVLRFQMRFGRKLLNEKKLFELVRAVPVDEAKPVIEALRHLLLSYGEAARRHAREHVGETLRSGDNDLAPAALSEAALTLASMDDESAAALRGWFPTADQEHDSFAAEKVFAAYAGRTKFQGAEALRFGVWFFLHQWQTVSFERNWLGLFDVVRDTVSPELFARLAYDEARSLGDGDLSSARTGRLADDVERLIEQVGASAWGQIVADQLRRLAGS